MQLGGGNEILRNITEMGFHSPMTVQKQVIPYLLEKGNDVIALPKTGSDKTTTYGLTLLQKLNPSANRVTQPLVLSPTRELGLLISDNINDSIRYMKGILVVPVYDGSSIQAQIRPLNHDAQIIGATPRRLIDLMKRGKAMLDTVKNVALHQTNVMLNMPQSASTKSSNAPRPIPTLFSSPTQCAM